MALANRHHLAHLALIAALQWQTLFLANLMSTSHYSSGPYQGPQKSPNRRKRSVAYACGLGCLLLADLVAIQHAQCLGEALTIAGLIVLTIGALWKGDLL